MLDRGRRPVKTLELFHNATDFESYAPGRRIFSEGDPGERMYVVKEGEVEVWVGGRLIDTSGPGEILGEMALIDHRPRSATVLARTACQVVPIDEKRFLFLIQQTPYFAIQVMKVMAERLRQHLSGGH